MQKIIQLSLAASVLLAGSVAADTQLGEKTVLSGDVRAVYYAEDDGTNSENALGLGLNPTVTTDCLFTDKLKWEIGLGVAVPLSESSEGYGVEAGHGIAGDVAYDGNVSADASKSYAALTKLNGTFDYGSGFVKIGYQTLETPMADSDDIRLVPNTYFAGILAYTGIKNITLLAAHVSHMAGVVDSGSSEGPENYHSMSDVALGGELGGNDLVDDVGVSAVAGIYSNEEAGANGQLWYYSMPDAGVKIGNDDLGAVSAMYLDAGMAFGPVSVTAQYMSFATALWSNTATGVMAEVELEGGIGLVAAMNSYSFTDDGLQSAAGAAIIAKPAWYAWGGYPEFVAGEEVDASFGDWDGGSASMVGASYGGVENLGLSATYLTYTDTVSAVDVVAEYSIDDAMSAVLIYETKTYEDAYKTAEGVDDTTTTEVKFFYTF